MAQDNIPKNQVKSRNSIEQREHEDDAAARRVTLVDADGEFQDETNPSPTIQFFLKNGDPQVVTEDTVDPSNNHPLPVKLTGLDGDVVINSENLNLETQNDGVYDVSDNPDPDSTAIIAHQRSTTTDDTKQLERPTAKRGTSDTDTVSSDVSLHDHSGNQFTETNQFPVNSSIRDGSNPALKTTVDSDLNLHVEVHGNDESGADKPFLLSGRGDVLVGKVSTLNATTTPLSAGGVFTGVFEEVKDCAFLSFFIYSDVASAANGLELHWTDDSTFSVWRTELTNLTAGASRSFAFGVRARYFRVKYTNGAMPQGTFVVGTVCHPSGTGIITKPLNGSVNGDNFAQLVQAPIMARLADDTYANVAGLKLDSTAFLGTIDHDAMFGHLGHTFEITIEAGTGSVNERALMLISNPAGSGKVLRFDQIIFGLPSTGTVIYRLYMFPTVTANGTQVFPVGGRQVGQSAAVVEFYTLPTVSAFGSKFAAVKTDATTLPYTREYNYSRLLDPGFQLLVTAEQSIGAGVSTLDIEYSEL